MKNTEIFNIFFLCSFHRGQKGTDVKLDEFIKEINKSNLNIETYINYLDMKRVSNNSLYFEKYKETIKAGYENIKFNCLVALDNDALDFLLKYRNELFPEVSIVFISLNDYDKEKLKKHKNITGTSENTDYVSTISIYTKLDPELKNVYIITDNSATGKAHYEAIKKIENNFEPKIKFNYLNFGNYNLNEFIKLISNLPENSVILLTQSGKDKSGESYPTDKSSGLIASKSSVPCLIVSETRFGYGTLGGKLVSWKDHSRIAANMVVKILKGENADNIQIKLDVPNQYEFDFNALKRFNLNLNKLPEKSLIINKPHNYFIENIKTIIIFLAFIICEFFIFLLLGINFLKRKKVEKELLIKESNFNLISEISSAMISEVNLKGEFLYVNQMHKNILGYEPEEMLGKTAFEFGNKDFEKEALQKFDKAIKPGDFQDNVWKFKTKSGDWKWVKCYSKSYLNDSKETIINVISFDISEQIENEERFRALFEYSPISIWEQDFSDIKKYFDKLKESKIDNLNDYLENNNNEFHKLALMVKINDVNERSVKYFEAENKSDLIKNIREYFAPESITGFQEILVALFEGKSSINVEIPIMNLKKELRYLSLNLCVVPGRENDLNKIIISFVDITEKKKMNIEREFYYNAFNSSFNEIYMFNADNYKYEYASRGGLQNLGYSFNELQFKTPFDIMLNSSFDKFVNFIKPLQNGKLNVLKFESMHKRIDGSKYPVEVNMQLIEKDGRKAYLEIVQDISERKKNEEIIKSSLVEKETLLRELYHRTKNNMSVIISYLELQKVYSNIEKFNYILDDIIAHIKSMALAHQKLYQSKSLSKISLKDYIIDLTTFINSMFNTTFKSITIDYDLDDIKTLIDIAIPLGLVLSELITNCYKHAFPGMNNGLIKISLKKKNNNIELKVSDDGVGLPENFNINKTKTLGLTTIKSIVEKQLKGYMEIENHEGLKYFITFKNNSYKERVKENNNKLR